MNLKSELSRFEKITLSEMDNVKLMSRTDTKFAFNISKLSKVLEKLSQFYRVMEIDGERAHHYK